MIAAPPDYANTLRLTNLRRHFDQATNVCSPGAKSSRTIEQWYVYQPSTSHQFSRVSCCNSPSLTLSKSALLIIYVFGSARWPTAQYTMKLSMSVGLSLIAAAHAAPATNKVSTAHDLAKRNVCDGVNAMPVLYQEYHEDSCPAANHLQADGSCGGQVNCSSETQP